jgi:hypothetical protein
MFNTARMCRVSTQRPSFAAVSKTLDASPRGKSDERLRCIFYNEAAGDGVGIADRPHDHPDLTEELSGQRTAIVARFSV